jgi:hypothetical protein
MVNLHLFNFDLVYADIIFGRQLSERVRALICLSRALVRFSC